MKNYEKESKKHLSIPIIVCVLIIILLMCILVILIFKTKDTEPLREEPSTITSVSGKGTIITPNNVDDVLNETTKNTSDAHYRTIMNVDWNFEDGSSASSDAYVENSTSNSRTVYFTVTLKNGEVVYTSPDIPLGSALQDIKLDKELSKGDYNATLTYHLIDDERNEVTTLSVAVTLHILN